MGDRSFLLSRSGLQPGHYVPWRLQFFDTVGTLVGVAQQAGLMRDDRLPRARQAFVSDAVGTVAGAALGTSTVTVPRVTGFALSV